MTVAETIAYLKAELDAQPLAAWSSVNKLIDSGSWSMELRAALHQVRCEIAAVLNEQLLLEWFKLKEIKEADWLDYSFDGVSVYLNGEVIASLGGFS